MPETTVGHFIAPLSLETQAGEISPRRLALLSAIAANGSISGAAKAVGITYKAAWDAVEAINNLAGTMLIRVHHGGRGGGGAELTDVGARVLGDFTRVQELQKNFLADLDGDDGFDASMRVVRRILLRSSARNVLHGTVSAVISSAVNSEVSLLLPGGDTLHAVLTRESAETLELEPGREAQALIKASWIVLAEAQESIKTSARNRLCGVVRRITVGEINAEVVLVLSGGSTLAATITLASLQDMQIAEGRRLCALIKASHIILGVST